MAKDNSHRQSNRGTRCSSNSRAIPTKRYPRYHRWRYRLRRGVLVRRNQVCSPGRPSYAAEIGPAGRVGSSYKTRSQTPLPVTSLDTKTHQPSFFGSHKSHFTLSAPPLDGIKHCTEIRVESNWSRIKAVTSKKSEWHRRRFSRCFCCSWLPTVSPSVLQFFLTLFVLFPTVLPVVDPRHFFSHSSSLRGCSFGSSRDPPCLLFPTRCRDFVLSCR